MSPGNASVSSICRPRRRRPIQQYRPAKPAVRSRSAAAEILARIAPSAVRTHISARRAIPRTSSRLAMFAHAINRTRPAIHISRCRCEEYSLLHPLNSGPPGVSTTWTFASNAFAWRLTNNPCSGRKRLPQQRTDFLLQRPHRHPGFHAPNHVEPSGPRDRAHTEHSPSDRHRFDRQIEIRRRARHPIAVKALWGDAYDRYRACVHPKGASDHGRIAGIVALPCLIAHHRRHGRALDVIRYHSASVRLAAATRMCGSNFQRQTRPSPSGRLGCLPSRRTVIGRDREARLHRRQFLKLRRILLQVFVRFGRE